MSSKAAKKSASFDALVNAATKEKEETKAKKNESTQTNKSLPKKEIAKKLGRPRKIEGERIQLPSYLPKPLYFEMLDYVNLKKRSDRQFSLNDVLLESLDLWLKSIGKPSIKELIDIEKQ